jgi:hypothetical protein
MRSFDQIKRNHQMSEAFFAVQEVAQECDMRNRVIAPDPLWDSAISESTSTLVGRPQYKERIEQAYERLESRQFTTGLPKILRPTSSVICEPACRAPLCMATREWLREFDITEFTCSGCHICVSFQRGRGA